MPQEEMLSQTNSMLQSLQQVNASQAETIIRLTRKNESLQNRLNELTAQVAWLNRQFFGHKSKKLPSLDSNQTDLFGDFLPDNAAELEEAREVAVQTITKETVESKKQPFFIVYFIGCLPSSFCKKKNNALKLVICPSALS